MPLSPVFSHSYSTFVLKLILLIMFFFLNKDLVGSVALVDYPLSDEEEDIPGNYYLLPFIPSLINFKYLIVLL